VAVCILVFVSETDTGDYTLLLWTDKNCPVLGQQPTSAVVCSRHEHSDVAASNYKSADWCASWLRLRADWMYWKDSSLRWHRSVLSVAQFCFSGEDELHL